MKIKNQIAYYQGIEEGKDAYGDRFGEFTIKVADTLEEKMSRGAKLTAELLKETTEEVHKGFGLFMLVEFRKKVLTLLGKAWWHGEPIEGWLKKGKLL